MRISEKQIIQLMQIAHTYLRTLNTLCALDGTLLSKCGLHNRIEIANILTDIGNQQSDELEEFKE